MFGDMVSHAMVRGRGTSRVWSQVSARGGGGARNGAWTRHESCVVSGVRQGGWRVDSIIDEWRFSFLSLGGWEHGVLGWGLGVIRGARCVPCR